MSLRRDRGGSGGKDEGELGELSRYHRSRESDESIIAGATPLITSTPPPYKTQGKGEFKGG